MTETALDQIRHIMAPLYFMPVPAVCLALGPYRASPKDLLMFSMWERSSLNNRLSGSVSVLLLSLFYVIQFQDTAGGETVTLHTKFKRRKKLQTMCTMLEFRLGFYCTVTHAWIHSVQELRWNPSPLRRLHHEPND